jgi:hypothetical protein
LNSMKIVSAFCVFLFAHHVLAEQHSWTTVVGTPAIEHTPEIQQTSDGYVIAGMYTTTRNSALLIKLSLDGNLLWSKKYSFCDGIISFQKTSDSGFIAACGRSVFRWNANGDVLWHRNLGGYAEAIRETKDGGFVVAGIKSTLWVAKLDGSGTISWQKLYTLCDDYAEAKAILQSRNGDYIVAGYSPFCGGPIVLQLSAEGEPKWLKSYQSQYGSDFGSMIKTKDGGFLLGLYSRNKDQTRGFDELIKLNSAGAIIWQKRYPGDCCIQSVRQTSDGGYITAGKYLAKLNPSGDIEWRKKYIQGKFQSFNSIKPARSGGYIAAGIVRFSDMTDETDIRIVKLDPNGNGPNSSCVSVRDSLKQPTDGSFEVQSHDEMQVKDLRFQLRDIETVVQNFALNEQRCQ